MQIASMRFNGVPEAMRATLRTIVLDAYLGARSVLRQKRRSAFGICAVAFGVVALIVGGGFIEWIFWGIREGTIESGVGHIQVVRPKFFDAGLSDPFKFLLPENASERTAIEAMAGVKVVAPRLSLSGLVSFGEATVSFVAEGVDPAKEAAFVGLIIAEGEPLSAEDPKGVIMGRGLALNLHVKVGDGVVLLVNTPSGGINAVDAKVRGLFSTVSKAYDDSAIRIPLSMAHGLLRISGVHKWVVVLDETERTDMTLAALKQRFSGQRLEFVPWRELADFYNKTITLMSRQLAIVYLIIAVIIVLSISNTLTMSVIERTGEIGTAMALGQTRANVMRQFLTEGVMLGVIGAAFGGAAGLVLAYIVSKIGIPMPPPPGMARGYTGEIRVTAGLVGNALTLAFTTTLLASLYPAWKASRLLIVNALRHNR
jgi:putative ABC transport system permease protein